MIEISIFFDVETLPTIDPAIVEMVSERVQPPGTMKKAETIQAWMENERQTAIAEAVAKTALDGGMGRIAAIAFAVGDGVVMSATSAGPDGYDVAVEKRLLERFLDRCDAVRRERGVPPILVGHNITGFDVRWLWKRSIILGVQAPHWWPVDAKPWDQDRVVDTMELWEGRGGRISLDRLARTLGLAGKGNVDGSQVAGLWAEGRYEDVRLYCGDDVELDGGLVARMAWLRSELDTLAQDVAKAVPSAGTLVSQAGEKLQKASAQVDKAGGKGKAA